MHAFFWIILVSFHFSRNTFLDFTKELPVMVGIKSRTIDFTTLLHQLSETSTYVSQLHGSKKKVKVKADSPQGVDIQ